MLSAYKHFFYSLHHARILFSILFHLHVLSSIFEEIGARPTAGGRAHNKSAPAIFIFGDSTSDPGNNNFISSPFKGNFPPYGRDFPHHVATGRFTNGRLVCDFIAEHIGSKDYVPPYLDPSLSIQDLSTGVSFASAGSGFDPLTPTISDVISLPQQLEYFKEYKEKLKAAIGKEKSEELVKKGLYVISAGTNDFVVNYFTLPIRRKTYDLPSYMAFCLQLIRQFLQGLLNLGARRIGFASLAPMGCLPLVITLNSENAISKRDCIDSFSVAARDFNAMVQKELHAIQSNWSGHGTRIALLDVYKPTEDMVLKRKFDFEEVATGCCGTGLIEATFLCNSKSPVCSDASKYVFWDSIHPTEEAYALAFRAIRPTIDFLIKN